MAAVRAGPRPRCRDCRGPGRSSAAPSASVRGQPRPALLAGRDSRTPVHCVRRSASAARTAPACRRGQQIRRCTQHPRVVCVFAPAATAVSRIADQSERRRVEEPCMHLAVGGRKQHALLSIGRDEDRFRFRRNSGEPGTPPAGRCARRNAAPLITLARTWKRKWTPSGKNVGQRCEFSPWPVSMSVAGSTRPPSADTLASPSKIKVGTEHDDPDGLHAPPLAVRRIGDGDRHAARNRDSHQLADERRTRATVRPATRTAAWPLRCRDDRGIERVERTHEQAGRRPVADRRERNSSSVRGDDGRESSSGSAGQRPGEPCEAGGGRLAWLRSPGRPPRSRQAPA